MTVNFISSEFCMTIFSYTEFTTRFSLEQFSITKDLHLPLIFNVASMHLSILISEPSASDSDISSL